MKIAKEENCANVIIFSTSIVKHESAFVIEQNVADCGCKPADHPAISATTSESTRNIDHKSENKERVAQRKSFYSWRRVFLGRFFFLLAHPPARFILVSLSRERKKTKKKYSHTAYQFAEGSSSFVPQFAYYFFSFASTAFSCVFTFCLSCEIHGHLEGGAGGEEGERTKNAKRDDALIKKNVYQQLMIQRWSHNFADFSLKKTRTQNLIQYEDSDNESASVSHCGMACISTENNIWHHIRHRWIPQASASKALFFFLFSSFWDVKKYYFFFYFEFNELLFVTPKNYIFFFILHFNFFISSLARSFFSSLLVCFYT